MYRKMLKSKIHRVTATEVNLTYVGSITIDEDLMGKAAILENEMVQVLNINNGERFETYVMTGAKDTGVICLNGAAARKVQPGDKLIIISYGLYSEEELKILQPIVVHVNEDNKIINLK